MKAKFETQWEREFESAMRQQKPSAASCMGGCLSIVFIVGLILFFGFWLLIELTERL